VHLSGDAHGEAPQLVAAAPSTTVAQFEAMIAERISDEYRLTNVQITSLKSMEGDLLQCGRTATVRELVAEVGCALTANIVGGSSASPYETQSPNSPRSEAEGRIRPQLFGKPSIALQIYQRTNSDVSRDDPTGPKLLLVSQRILKLEHGGLSPMEFGPLDGPVEAAVAVEDSIAVATCSSWRVQFLPHNNGEPSACPVAHPVRGLYSVWGGSLLAMGEDGALTLVHRREARQLTMLAGVDCHTVSCSDGQHVYYVVYDPANLQHTVQLWQVGRELQPQQIASAALPQPQAVVCHNGVVHIFASGLYRLGSDNEIRVVHVTGPDAFIIHSVTAATSDNSSIFAISGADSCEVWEICNDGACKFIVQAPTHVQAIIPTFDGSNCAPRYAPP